MATIVSANVTPVGTGNGRCALDASTTDLDVCTSADITYKFERTTTGEPDASITYTSTLPQVGGVTVAVWKELPPTCSGAGSGISSDGLTLTCIIPGPLPAGTDFKFAQATVLSTTPNGTVIPNPSTVFSSPQTPSPLVAESISGPVRVLAKPTYDLQKKGLRAIPYPGPSGESGFLLVYHVRMLAPSTLQGLEAWNGPVVITDTVPTAGASGSRIVTWGPAAGRSCVGNGDPGHLGLGSGEEERDYGSPFSYASYAEGTAPANSVTQPGTCAITQSAGAGTDVTLSISGANLLTARYPTLDVENNPLPASDHYLFDYAVTLWEPDTNFPPGMSQLVNSVTLTGTSVTGQPNTDPSPGNETGTITINHMTSGGFFHKQFDSASTGAAEGAGDGRIVPGQVVNGEVLYSNTDSISNTVRLCEKIDNTRFQLVSAAPNTSAGPGGTVEYGVGGLNGAGITWASEDHMREGTCADDQSTAWYTSLAAVPGGAAAITKLRFVPVAQVAAGQFAQIVYQLRALDTYAFDGWGGATAGTTIPTGAPLHNWGAYSVDGNAFYSGGKNVQDSAGRVWGVAADGADPTPSVYGDRVYLVRAFVSTRKETVIPDNSATQVLAGDTITYRLTTVLSNPASSLGMPSTSVTVTDILPPGLSYVPNSSSAPGATGPVQVQPGVPAAGYTTLTWTFDNVTPQQSPGVNVGPIVFQALVDPLMPNGKAIPNILSASSPANPYVGGCSSPTGSGIYDGELATGYTINTETGEVSGRLCRGASRRDMTASTPGGKQVRKEVLTPTVTPGAPIQFRLNWGRGGSTTDNSDLIDVLPYNGDGRTPATSYTGSYGLAVAPVIVNDGSPASTVYYTSAAPATISPDPNDASNALAGGSTVWCTQAQLGNAGCPASLANATALRIVSGAVQADGVIRSTTITLNTTGNRQGDVYSNTFSMRGTINGTPLVSLTTSNTATAQVQVAAVTVAKALTAESGSRAGIAEAGEQLTYTITLANAGDTAASSHAFHEVLPAHSTLVSITGTGVRSDCAAGDVGTKLCTLTVTGPIAANGGTATATVIVTVASPLPSGVTSIVNLVTDNTRTPPEGCDPATQTCERPPACDPATDPAHCVVTPVVAALAVDKSVAMAPQLVEGTTDEFVVRYAIAVTNNGSRSAEYDLIDTPRFDGDVSIVAATWTRGSEAAVTLPAATPWTLATGRSLAPGATDTYGLEIRTRVAAGSDQRNDRCSGTAGNGLFNEATLRVGDDEQHDDACTETPVPRVAARLSIEKRGSVRQAEVGDIVHYTLRVRNTGDVAAIQPVIVDRLPAGFRLVDNTVRVRGATLTSLDGAPGPLLRIGVDRIAPGAELTVAYRVRIGVGAMEGDGVNRAHVECRATAAATAAATATATATAICSNEDRWKVDSSGGAFSEEGGIVGQVFVDCNYDSVKSAEELGIPGVRLYLQDGTYLISDVEGKYSHWGLRPTTYVLKVDASTLPTRSRMVTSSPRNMGDANSLFVDLKKGEMHRADFIEGSCNNEVIEQVKARRAQGEVRSVETESGQPSLKLKDKPAPQGNPLQEGTDSADQVIEQMRHRLPSPGADDASPAERTPEPGGN